MLNSTDFNTAISTMIQNIGNPLSTDTFHLHSSIANLTLQPLHPLLSNYPNGTLVHPISHATNTNDDSTMCIRDLAGLPAQIRILMTVLHWYTIVAIAAGLGVNFYAGILLIYRHRQFQFLPHLAGIIFGNFTFLSMLAFLNLHNTFGHRLEFVSCQMLVYCMAVSQHIATLCLAAIAVERYIRLYQCQQFIRLDATDRHRQWRLQSVTVCILVGTCMIIQAWVLEMVTQTPCGCTVDYSDPERRDLIRTLMLASTIVVYFTPFMIAAIVNTLLLWRLFRPKSGMMHSSSNANSRPSVSSHSNTQTKNCQQHLLQHQTKLLKPEAKAPAMTSQVERDPRSNIIDNPLFAIDNNIKSAAGNIPTSSNSGKLFTKPQTTMTKSISRHQTQNRFPEDPDLRARCDSLPATEYIHRRPPSKSPIDVETCRNIQHNRPHILINREIYCSLSTVVNTVQTQPEQSSTDPCRSVSVSYMNNKSTSIGSPMLHSDKYLSKGNNVGITIDQCGTNRSTLPRGDDQMESFQRLQRLDDTVNYNKFDPRPLATTKRHKSCVQIPSQSPTGTNAAPFDTSTPAVQKKSSVASITKRPSRLSLAPLNYRFSSAMSLLNIGGSRLNSTKDEASVHLPSPRTSHSDSIAVIPPQLIEKLNRNKRRTMILFVALISTDMILNFPNQFFNIADRYGIPIFSNPFVVAGVQFVNFVLWHLQFIVSALCVKLPFFERNQSPTAVRGRRKKNNKNGASHFLHSSCSIRSAESANHGWFARRSTVGTNRSASIQVNQTNRNFLIQFFINISSWIPINVRDSIHLNTANNLHTRVRRSISSYQ